MARRTTARQPGRPPAGTDQSQRLLDAALACYVRQGIGVTSLRDVASEAGVTPALVHYYFGDAAALTAQVIEQRLMPVFAEVRARLLRAADEDPVVLVTEYVNAIFSAIQSHPWWPSLWVREVLSEGGALRDLLATRVAPGLTQVMAQRFAAAQAAGRLNPQLDARLLVVSVIGLTLFPAAGAPIWRRMPGAGELSLEHLRKHALALLLHGMEATS